MINGVMYFPNLPAVVFAMIPWEVPPPIRILSFPRKRESTSALCSRGTIYCALLPSSLHSKASYAKAKASPAAVRSFRPIGLPENIYFPKGAKNDSRRLTTPERKCYNAQMFSTHVFLSEEKNLNAAVDNGKRSVIRNPKVENIRFIRFQRNPQHETRNSRPETVDSVQ